jgi:hypothetical protein
MMIAPLDIITGNAFSCFAETILPERFLELNEIQ